MLGDVSLLYVSHGAIGGCIDLLPAASLAPPPTAGHVPLPKFQNYCAPFENINRNKKLLIIFYINQLHASKKEDNLRCENDLHACSPNILNSPKLV